MNYEDLKVHLETEIDSSSLTYVLRVLEAACLDKATSHLLSAQSDKSLVIGWEADARDIRRCAEKVRN